MKRKGPIAGQEDKAKHGKRAQKILFLYPDRLRRGAQRDLPTVQELRMVIPLSCAAILMTVDAKPATGTNRQLIERQLPAVLPEAKDSACNLLREKRSEA
jgi:hypothetical protein